MLSFEPWVFSQNRHPGDNPAIDEDLNGHDGDGNEDLFPMHKFTMGKIPVEGDKRDVEPVEDDAHEGEHGRDLHETCPPFSASNHK